MAWYCWIYLFIILTFFGYIYNRIIFWIGAFIWEWSANVIFGSDYWFTTGTTIKSLMDDIRYKEGEYHSSYYPEENDAYVTVSCVRWIAGFNILSASVMFLLNIIGFVGALACIFGRFIGLVIWGLWICIGQYIYKFIKICIKYIWLFLVKIKVVSFLVSLYRVTINIRNKILNFEIA